MKRDIQWLLGPQVDEDSVDVPGDDAGFECEDASLETPFRELPAIRSVHRQAFSGH